jgi:DNA-binding SARP family transcriptional activator
LTLGVVRVEVLGPVLLDGQGLRRRDRVVLAALVAEGDRVVAPDALATALWNGNRPPTWSKVVQGSVMHLRRLLGVGAVETTSGGYRLAVAGTEIDAVCFRHLVEQGRTLSALGDHERAASAFESALELWRGAPLTELEGWPPGEAEAASLLELRCGAEEAWLDDRLAAGHHAAIVDRAATLAAAEPMRERRWLLLAIAQYRCGQQAQALRSLRQARTVLAERAGLAPSDELVALEQRILQQDGSLAAPAGESGAGVERCPYKGLVPYDVDDADDFFGRETQVSACLDKLARVSLLAIAGASGNGKSSLVRAGLVPVLARQGRCCLVLSPGPDPAGELTEAIASAGDEAIVVVDQLEELLATGDHELIGRVLDALVARSGGAGVIVVLRADRIGQLAEWPPFARLVESGLHLVGSMDAAELRAAVEGPARRAGYRLEPGLVELLVDEVGDEPGALPLLSHVLRQTWERRDGHVLTVAGYRATGGIRGAIAQTAETLYERLQYAHDGPRLVRSTLLRLVAPAPDGGVECHPAPLADIARDADHRQVVEELLGARLLVADQDSVELAHEALVREWPRLREWLDEDVEGQKILRHVSGTAAAWDAMGRPDNELYSGSRLSGAVEWVARADPDLTAVESEFIAAGTARERDDREAEREQLRRERRGARRLRAVVVVTALALVVALGLG